MEKIFGTITNEQLNQLPIKAFDGEIVVVDSLYTVNASIKYLSSFNEIGFDTETRPSFQKGKINNVALLQLSTAEKAFLFRICSIGLPNAVTEFLENKNIKKIGVAIRDDIKALQKIANFTPGGFIELQNYVKDFGIEAAGLKKLNGIVLGYRISKAQQLSNWESPTLTPKQKIYGATDAWSALLIYNKLSKLHKIDNAQNSKNENTVMKNAFHAYDIRGIFNKDFNAQDVYKIGFFVPELLKTDKIIVGRDGRNSSPEIHKALLEGITDSGADVYDIGIATTPMVYFATANYQFKAGIQITASHNPKEYNGLKISRENALPVGLDSGLDTLLQLATTKAINPSPKKGNIIQKNILDDYIKFQKQYFEDLGNLKIGVDCSNGVGSIIAKHIWGNAPLYINDQLDGNFPCHEPNPLLPQNTIQMQKFVVDNNLDLGLVFDGDADRVVFIDNKGRHVPPDLIIAAMGQYFFEEKKRSGLVIQDIRTSKSVDEYLAKYNAKTFMWKVGRANAAPKLREIDGLYGGEYAGHYYFRDFFFSDSGVLAGSIILQVANKIKKNGGTFANLIDQIKNYENSGEINFKIEDKKAAMERVKNFYIAKEQPIAIYDFDGYRIEYPQWWVNIRMSNTEPYLRLLCEAKNKQLLDEKVAEITKLINNK